VPSRLVLGARPSKLSLAQCELALRRIKDIGLDCEIRTIRSAGDRDLQSPLYATRGQGIFVSDINNELLDGNIDVAVHSAKDLPAKLGKDLRIVSVLPRDDPRDSLVSPLPLESLIPGSVIGTSSLRRMFELRKLRPDLRVMNVRGNLETRIGKIGNGYDAVVLAEAGLRRMNVEAKRFPFTVDQMVPAPNQGIIALVCVAGSYAERMVEGINDEQSYIAMSIEREIMDRLNLGCSAPAGIFASKSGDIWHVISRFYNSDGTESKTFRDKLSDSSEAASLAIDIKRRLGNFVNKIRDHNQA